MSECRDISLQRAGTPQSARKPAALTPDYVKVDERTLADFLVFANRYAGQVHYYNSLDMPGGDWRAFFNSEPGVVIAMAGSIRPERIKKAFLLHFELLEKDATVGHLNRLFRYIFEGFQQIDHWHRDLGSSNLKEELTRLIRANLQAALHRLIAYEKGAAEVLTDYAFDPSRYTGFGKEWKASASEVNLIPSQPGVFGTTGTQAARILNSREALRMVFQTCYKNLLKLKEIAPAYLDQALDHPANEPHFALFLAFVRMYQRVQGDLNRITQRHLDFFYREVLRLKEKPAVSDKVHLVFELAKHVSQHKLKKDILFKGGKDATGKELYYRLDEETIIHKAQVEELKTIFVDDDASGIKSIHAAPIANSGDGEGGDFDETDKPFWNTFGSMEMPNAEIGFAIASPLLLLKEGIRKIILTLTGTGKAGTLTTDSFKISLTGEKDWIENVSYTIDDATFTITINLDETQPAVTTLKTDSWGAKHPMIRVLLNTEASSYAYQALKDFQISTVKIVAHANGLENLTAKNDLSTVDVSKSFQPFGPRPETDSQFRISSEEVLGKKLTSATLHIGWEGLPSENFNEYYEGYDLSANLPDSNDYYATAKVLTKSGHVLEGDLLLFHIADSGVADDSTPEKEVVKSISFGSLREIPVPNPNAPDKPVYFLTLGLGSQDFFHGDFAKIYARQVLAQAKYPDGVIGALYKSSGTVSVFNPAGDPEANLTDAPGEVLIPKEPYTPAIKTFSLDYIAEATGSDCQFYYLHPFAGYEKLTSVIGADLLPQFEEEGALLIGIKDLDPPTNLSLLFQVAEATADPDTPKTEVFWYYLDDNTWQQFEEKEFISDTTKGLIRSGIVNLDIPKTIDKGNTVLASGLHWIKAEVTKDSKAICKSIAVHTQAAQATFTDQGNDPNHLKTPLKAGSVSKLKLSDSSLKKIDQPYDSFGGKTREDSASFYTRISERLRHKGRAITLFDYERLVLEQFPQIYKVKCLNHTYSEEPDDLSPVPGHVTLAVLPNWKNRRYVNPWEPRVNISLLEEIKEYLEGINTLFVTSRDETQPGDFGTLHVRNPKYERIKIECRVAFRPGKTGGFYKEQLKLALRKYLAPWAFDEGAEIHFGGKVYKSSLLNFVEEQSYVDYVSEFRMMKGGTNDDVNEIAATTARSILVSAEDHEILNPIPGCAAQHPLTWKGIGAMTIEQDFEPT